MSPNVEDAIPVIAIDGPVGSGKGTISRRIAQQLGWNLLESGALYRVLALAAERHAIALDNAAVLATLAAHLDVQFITAPDGTPGIVLEGEGVTDVIRSETYGNAASRAAALPEVRSGLLERQRAFREAPGLVADGRDMGTVVFPDAALKVYLTASPGERARRRYKQLKEKGMNVNLNNLVKEIAARDERDASRPVAPLKPAPDAECVDSTGLGIDAVVEHVMRLARQRLAMN